MLLQDLTTIFNTLLIGAVIYYIGYNCGYKRGHDDTKARFRCMRNTDKTTRSMIIQELYNENK